MSLPRSSVTIDRAAHATRVPTSARHHSPSPARPNEVWTLFTNRFFFMRKSDGNGVTEKLASALARCLQPLKRMAEPEDWIENDAILVSYFVHTFHALDRAQNTVAENTEQLVYVAEHEGHIHFHTGLVTSNMEPIYARFPKNKNPKAKDNQYFISDGPASNHFLLSIHMGIYCNPGPEQCRYFDDCSHLVMDPIKPLPQPNWTHIYDQNWDRVCRVLFGEEYVTDRSFKERMRTETIQRLNGALTMATKRVKAHYRTAVPQYYKSQIQLLLPLYLKGNYSKADLVLTISRQAYNPPQPGKFTYSAATVLTVAMAYQNARLIVRPERDWLYAPSTMTDADIEQF